MIVRNFTVGNLLLCSSILSVKEFFFGRKKCVAYGEKMCTCVTKIHINKCFGVASIFFTLSTSPPVSHRHPRSDVCFVRSIVL